MLVTHVDITPEKYCRTGVGSKLVTLTPPAHYLLAGAHDATVRWRNDFNWRGSGANWR
jgi:hypothetical protein